MKQKQDLSFWKLWNLSFGFFGVQIAYALQSANISRIFATLGADPHSLSYFWILPPLMGILVQPIVGTLSDRTWCRFGRRIPYLFIGSAVAVAVMCLLPNAGSFGMAVSTAMVFGLISLMFLDTSINMAMQPFKMLVGDMVNEKQKSLAYSIQSFLCNSGSLIGYVFPFFFTAIGIANEAPKGVVPDSVIYSFYIGAAILILCVLYTTLTVKEWNPKEYAEYNERKPEAEEQMITNNRQASSYASGNLYRPIDAEYLKELVYLLTDGMDQGGQDYRSTNEVDFTPTSGEAFEFPSVRTIPDRLGELSAFLELPNTHPLVKAAVAQAYLMILRPFPEGNERLGRMVSNIILLRAGYTFFSEISLSALIARRSYSYYEAMLNILREENGCDLTYFIEYYLELLSRAVEERRLRQRQKEERARQEEMALARTPLMAAAVPATDPTPPDGGRPAPPGPETAEASEVPTETDPNNPERGGENKDWLSADSWAGNETEMDSETSIARVRDELHRLASNSGPVMKTGAKFLLSLMDNQVDV